MDGQFAFLSLGYMAVGTQQAQEEYCYPGVSMRGSSCFLIWIRCPGSPARSFRRVRSSPEEIMEHLHTHRRLYLASTPPTVQTALDELWQLRDSHELGLIKLLSARLLWEVKRQPVEASPSIRYFTAPRWPIARETREILCADLSQNHTVREFAQRFQVSETSLKNYFRGVFGENLSTFLREARMRRAARLLRDTELRVAEIAAQWATRIKVNSRRSLPGSSAAHRWNIAEGHGSIEPVPFSVRFQKALCLRAVQPPLGALALELHQRR